MIQKIKAFVRWMKTDWFPAILVTMLVVGGAFVTGGYLAQAQDRGGITPSGSFDISGAKTAAGNDAPQILRNCSLLFVQVPVTAGSGTVTTFNVWLESTADGSTWTPIVCQRGLRRDAATIVTNTHLLMAETSLQTSGTASFICDLPAPNVRAAWNVIGTTPSETFSVNYACQGAPPTNR